MYSKPDKIGLIGLGEAGGILAAEFSAQGVRVDAYDVLIETAAARPALHAKAAATGARLTASLAEAVQAAPLVISAVTATSARQVASECARLLKSGQTFLDINSISPHAKRDNARAIEASGAKYVEAAVMAPVPPQRLRVPILLGGRTADAAHKMLSALGMNTRVVSEEIGIASAIKMCRSILVKGLEALTVECMFAARRYGAEDAVLASLHKSYPSLGWDGAFPDNLISRVAEHGRRRAAEMREVAATLQDVGMSPIMAAATAQRHDDLIDAMQSRDCSFVSQESFSWRELADRLHKS